MAAQRMFRVALRWKRSIVVVVAENNILQLLLYTGKKRLEVSQ